MEKEQEALKNLQRFDVSVKIWADDKTDVYVGNCKEITSELMGTQSHPHPSSFEFRFDGTCCDYLYFVCWSNDEGQNAFLAELQGDNFVFSGSLDWEVFATGKNKFWNNGQGDSVSIAEINHELERACTKGWKTPYNDGPLNTDDNNVLPYQSDIKNNAKFIWHNSGKDISIPRPSDPPVPFRGFNHDEFLIFRVPIKSLFTERCHHAQGEACDCDCDCACSCDGCNENAKAQNQELLQKARQKHQTLTNDRTGNPSPFRLRCRSLIRERANIVPSIYFHWGDSPQDVIENHDTEIVYITVCNPYDDIEFKGFRITSITLNPRPGQDHQARIIPDRFVNYDCLAPCSCQTREFTFLTRDSLNQYINSKDIVLEYCWDDIVLTKNAAYGATAFQINIVKDED